MLCAWVFTQKKKSSRLIRISLVKILVSSTCMWSVNTHQEQSKLYLRCFCFWSVGEVKQPKRRRKKTKGSVASADGGNGLFRKRKLTDEQVNMLEMSFGDEHKLESERKDRLAAELGLDPRQVAVWFQNRRARWKNKRLEEEYNKLKNSHDNVVVDKCRLESEVFLIFMFQLLLLFFHFMLYFFFFFLDLFFFSLWI